MNSTGTTLAANEFDGATPRRNLILFALLMALTIAAVAAMSPALLFLLDPARATPFSDESIEPVQFVLAFAVGSTVLSAVAIAVGLRLEPSVRMGVPLLRSWLAADAGASRPAWAILLRCCAFAFGLTVFVVASGFAFRSQLPELPENFVFPPIWQGILMMLGAAVREEILFRLFALNLLVWIAMKVRRNHEPTTVIVWSTNGFIALLFALMHLIPATQLLALNMIAICMAIALATSAGVVFGFVYWRHGLLMAMFTHAITSVLVYLGVRGMIAFSS